MYTLVSHSDSVTWCTNFLELHIHVCILHFDFIADVNCKKFYDYTKYTIKPSKTQRQTKLALIFAYKILVIYKISIIQWRKWLINLNDCQITNTYREKSSIWHIPYCWGELPYIFRFKFTAGNLKTFVLSRRINLILQEKSILPHIDEIWEQTNRRHW